MPGAGKRYRCRAQQEASLRHERISTVRVGQPLRPQRERDGNGDGRHQDDNQDRHPPAAARRAIWRLD